MIRLYVKTHQITGLKYFGKTTREDYEKYRGSGLYWSKHCEKHGWKISTKIIAEFQDNDLELAKQFAVQFSKDNNIVKSNDWANLKEETLDGGWDYINHPDNKIKYIEKSKKTIANYSEERRIQTNSKKAVFGVKNGMYGRNRSGKNNPRFGCTISDEHKNKIKDANKNKLVVKDVLTDTIIGLIDKSHPKILSGEWVSINLGKTRTEEFKLERSRKYKELGVTPPNPKGLLWWTNGSIDLRAKICPGPSFTRGRSVNRVKKTS